MFVFSMANLNAAVVQTQGKLIKVTENNVNLNDLVWKIKKLTGYEFVCDSDDLKKYDNISINKEGSIDQILKEVLEETDLTFYSDDNIYVIKRKDPEVKKPVQQEKKNIKGAVSDDQGIPLPGVSVVIKGTNVGVATNIDGEYSLEFEQANVVLVFSFVGMITQEIAYKGQSVINVALSADSETMEEVVVTGYTKIAKERSTGSFVQLSEEKLKEQVTTSVVDRLEGISAGLLVTEEDGESKITIRGTNAFHTDTNPLIVVDGFAIEGSFESINPNDIKSINILQDAAAASIWGVRAAAGVIVITTKKGRKGKVQVEASSYLTSEGKPDVDDLNIMSSSDLIDFYREAIESNIDPNLEGNQAALNVVEQIYRDYASFDSDRKFVAISNEGIAKLNALRNINSHKQYSDLMLRNATSFQHDISIRGGGEHNSFYFSTSYNDDKFIEKGNKDSRLSMLLNNDINLSDNLKVHLGINLVHQKETRNGIGLGFINSDIGDGALPKFQNMVDAQGNRLRIPYDISEDVKKNYESLGYLDWGYNPLDEIENRDVEYRTMSMRFQFGLNWRMLSSLSWDFKGQYEVINSKNTEENSMKTYFTRDLINRFTYFGEDGNFVHGVPKGAILDKTTGETKVLTMRSHLNFDKTFADRHQVTATAGMEVRESKESHAYQRLYGYDSQSLLYDTTVDWTKPKKQMYNGQEGSIRNEDRLSLITQRIISTFANFAYTFDNKYTLSASGKIDQTNLFGVNARLRANPLWSCGIAWNISRESFLEDVEWIDILKLRASYGVNGNVKKHASAFTTLEKIQDYNTRKFVYRFKNLGNPELSHEDTYMLNIAADYSFLNSRISGSIEVYNKVSKNLLAGFKTNPIYGASRLLLNNGEITNKGIVITLNAEVLKEKDFTWYANLNTTYNKNTVDKYENPASGLPFDDMTQVGKDLYSDNPRYIIGRDMSTIMAARWAGLSPDGRPQIYNENDEKIGYDKDIGDSDAFVIAGKLNPPVYGGFTNTFKYKNFNLSVLLSYKFGHVFRRHSANTMWALSSNDFTKGRFHKDYARRWRTSGDEEHTNVPGLPTKEITNDFGHAIKYNDYYQYSNLLVNDASHIDIRQISLSYSVGEKTLRSLKLPFESLKLSGQARNLGMLWEANKHRRDGFKPQPIYTFGVNVQF
jgi:TonB-linked SusC/RagA family outer membrane protein